MADEIVGRVAIANALTADLEAGQAEETSAPVESAPQSEEAKAPEAQQAAPAPAVAESPKALRAKVQGQEVEVPLYGEDGNVNPKLVEAFQKAEDYTRKMQAVAEDRRRVAEMEQQIKLQQAQAEANAKLAALPQLPEDDPYAQHMAILRQQQAAMFEAQQAERGFMEQQRVAVARERLEAEEARAVEQYKLGDRERDIVGQQLFARISSGDHSATYSAVAKEFHDYRESLRQEAEANGVKAWKEKHRAGAPAAAVSVPASGVPETKPQPGTRAFLDKIREEIASMV